MSTNVGFLRDDLLTDGVLMRRSIAWFIDMGLILTIVVLLWLALFMFGFVTLGLGMPLLGFLPTIPFFYNFGFLASGMSATPGQALMGLVVRRNDDLGPPTMAQALISTVIYYVTLATSGLLLLVALVTIRKRTFHDLLSGLVVIRSRALTAPPAFWNMTGGPTQT